LNPPFPCYSPSARACPRACPPAGMRSRKAEVPARVRPGASGVSHEPSAITRHVQAHPRGTIVFKLDSGRYAFQPPRASLRKSCALVTLLGGRFRSVLNVIHFGPHRFAISGEHSPLRVAISGQHAQDSGIVWNAEHHATLGNHLVLRSGPRWPASVLFHACSMGTSRHDSAGRNTSEVAENKVVRRMLDPRFAIWCSGHFDRSWRDGWPPALDGP
jgi:hypothetical protein